MRIIIVITGTRGAGKTTTIKKIACRLPDAIGVIAEKCFNADGDVFGYDAVLIPSLQRLPLCRRHSDSTFTERHGGYWFDPSVFIVVDAYIKENFAPSRPVIIDEIGNLEMEHCQGYFSTLLHLLQQPSLTLVVTLRSLPENFNLVSDTKYRYEVP